MKQNFFLILSLIFAILTSSIAADAATKRRSKATQRTAESVRKEKNQNAREIEKTKQKITTNTKEIQRQLNKLNLLEAEVGKQTKLVRAMQRRVDSAWVAKKNISDSVQKTKKRVEALRKSYSSSLTSMRSNRNALTPETFIFSSKSFSDIYRRVRYLREINQWQAEKSVELKSALNSLNTRQQHLDSVSSVLNASLKKLSDEKNKLQGQRNESSKLVSTLKRQGSNLKKALNERQVRARKLDAELDRIIAEEARKAAEEERRRKSGSQDSQQTKTQPNKDKASSKDFEKLSGTFSANRGKLPLPVDGTFTVTEHFGRNSHPDLSKIEVQNNGIDIETNRGANARAVFAGVVSSIFRMDGFQNVIIIRHGEYLTVYAGLSNLNVRKGQEVKTGQNLGVVYSDAEDSNRTILHFEIRHEKEKLDPMDWLKAD